MLLTSSSSWYTEPEGERKPSLQSAEWGTAGKRNFGYRALRGGIACLSLCTEEEEREKWQKWQLELTYHIHQCKLDSASSLTLLPEWSVIRCVSSSQNIRCVLSVAQQISSGWRPYVAVLEWLKNLPFSILLKISFNTEAVTPSPVQREEGKRACSVTCLLSASKSGCPGRKVRLLASRALFWELRMLAVALGNLWPFPGQCFQVLFRGFWRNSSLGLQWNFAVVPFHRFLCCLY